MKAIVHTKYGPPDELQLKEVEKPVPGDNEILIKIHATTVTTTDCNARNFTFVPQSFMFFARLMFGFKKPDKVIDYTKEDFTKSDERYDFVFGVVGKTTFSQCKGILKPKGIYLENMMEIKDFLKVLWTSIVGGKKIKVGVSTERAENLKFFIELIESGKLIPVIDKVYPLERTAEAFQYVEQGHKKGNVVISMNNERS